MVVDSRLTTVASRRRRPTGNVVAAIVVVVVAAALGWLAGRSLGIALVGASIGLAMVVAVGLTARLFGQRWLVGLTGGRPLETSEYPRLGNLVDGLCLAAGLDPPELRVVDDEAINAAVVSTRPGSAVIVVTSGAADGLDRVELEGVVAVLLARIRSGEAQSSSRSALGAGVVVLVSGALWRRRPGVGSVFLGVVGPLWGSLLRRLVPAETYLVADVAGALMTRYPPGLVAAYEKMERSSTMTPAAVPGAAHLWMASPLTGLSKEGTRRYSTHPPLVERIELLKEL